MTMMLGVLAAAAAFGHAPYEAAAVKPVGGSHVGGRIMYRACRAEPASRAD